MIKSVYDLEVYNLSLILSEKLYGILIKAPASEYDTTHNCKRAAKSIPANLAEGFAKRQSGPTFKNHLKICIGSSDEVVAHLQTLMITTPFLKTRLAELKSDYIILSKRLNSLYKNWKYNSKN